MNISSELRDISFMLLKCVSLGMQQSDHDDSLILAETAAQQIEIWHVFKPYTLEPRS